MKKNVQILSLLISALLLSATFSYAKSVGEVAILINTAQELEDKKLDWDSLKLKDPVMAESLVRTLEASKLKVSLIDGSYILLTENSKTKVENIEKEGKSFLRMFTGKLRAVVKKVVGPKSKFEVRTPTAIVGVKGTNFIVILTKDMTEIVVIEGSVSVANILEGILGDVIVKANYYTKVRRFEPPDDPIEMSQSELDKFIKKHRLADDIFIKEFSDVKDIEIHKEVDDPDIEGTTEDGEEVPLDDFGKGDIFDIIDDIVIEPPIEDTNPDGILDPPPPPNP